jgi:hypothetical protein
VGCQKATMELSLQNLQLLSHLHYPMDTHQLTSSQGEADGVSEQEYYVAGIRGVNSPCSWYRIRGQLPSTGGQDHTPFVLRIPRRTCAPMFLEHIKRFLEVSCSWEPGTRISTGFFPWSAFLCKGLLCKRPLGNRKSYHFLSKSSN